MVGDKTYIIDETMKNNWLALFEELRLFGHEDQSVLYAWWIENKFLIDQSISELKLIQAEEDVKE